MNDQLKIITFSLDEQSYGVGLPFVSKVIRAVEIKPLPMVSNHLVGIINFHGEIVPVLDIRKLLGLSSQSIRLTDQFIQLQIKSLSFFIITDSASQVKKFMANEMQTIEKNKHKKSDYISGIINNESDLIYILNINKLISTDELNLIESLKNNGVNIQ